MIIQFKQDTYIRDTSGEKIEVKKGQKMTMKTFSDVFHYHKYLSQGVCIEIKELSQEKKETKKTDEKAQVKPNDKSKNSKANTQANSEKETDETQSQDETVS